MFQVRGGYIVLPRHNGFINVAFTEGKFRVTLTKIILAWQQSCSIAKMGQIWTLEMVALKMNKSKFKEGFKQRPANIFTYFLKKLFIFKDQEKTDKW